MGEFLTKIEQKMKHVKKEKKVIEQKKKHVALLQAKKDDVGGASGVKQTEIEKHKKDIALLEAKKDKEILVQQKKTVDAFLDTMKADTDVHSSDALQIEIALVKTKKENIQDPS